MAQLRHHETCSRSAFIGKVGETTRKVTVMRSGKTIPCNLLPDSRDFLFQDGSHLTTTAECRHAPEANATGPVVRELGQGAVW